MKPLGYKRTTPSGDLIIPMNKVRINIQEYIDPDLVLRSASPNERKIMNNNLKRNN